MNFPGAASIDCEDCHKYHYDLNTGQIIKRGKSEKLVKRDGRPPCHSCPKKSPENGARLRLHPRNLRFLQFFKMVQAAGGRLPAGRENDSFTIQLLSIVKDLQAELDGKREHERWVEMQAGLEEMFQKRR